MNDLRYQKRTKVSADEAAYYGAVKATFVTGLGQKCIKPVNYKLTYSSALTPNTLNMMFRHQVWVMSLLNMRPNRGFTPKLISFHADYAECFANFMQESDVISKDFNVDIAASLHAIGLHLLRGSD